MGVSPTRALKRSLKRERDMAASRARASTAQLRQHFTQSAQASRLPQGLLLHAAQDGWEQRVRPMRHLLLVNAEFPRDRLKAACLRQDVFEIHDVLQSQNVRYASHPMRIQ